MTLKQIQKIGFKNCDYESTFGSRNHYREPRDLQPQLPDFTDLRKLLWSNYSKQEIRDFFKARYAIKYETIVSAVYRENIENFVDFEVLKKILIK